MRIALSLTFLLAFAGCGDDTGSGGDDLAMGGGGDLSAVADGGGGNGDGKMVACIPDLKSIALTPASSMVTLDGKAAAAIPFTATGTFADGSMKPIPGAQLAWSATRADDTPPGTISGDGVLMPNAQAGGVVTITAADGCNVSGSTTVTFTLNVTVGMPSNPNDWNGTPVTTGTLPTVVYPSDQTRFPRNIYRTLFQWRTASYPEFRLTFTGPGGTVTVFTDGAHMLCANKTPAAGCWEADETAWSFIAGSNAGQTVTWTLDALDKTGQTPVIRRAPPITIGFSKRDVVGAIFYWSTTSAGVRRGSLSSQYPEDYIAGKPATTYTNPTDTVQCVACHVVSRDGKYLAAPVQSQLTQSLWITQVTPQPPPTPLVTNIANTKGHGFATISPDDVNVVAAWGGKMWRVDRATGTAAEMLPVGMAGGTQPDWSPDNTQIVYATGAGDAPKVASLALLPWKNPGWGTPSILVQTANNVSNLFPQFDPEGDWIAFSRGAGGHDDLTAQLWIVPSKGGSPVELKAANRMVSNVLGDGQTENSQPTWAPPGDLHWIAFNSQREYGVVSPKGTQQIWVAAVDLSKAQNGMDPSYPAFRLQFQGLAENNHRAYWTLDIRDTPDGGVQPPPDLAGTCVPKQAGQSCNPVTDCCAMGYVCDTQDNGMTYSCIPTLQ